MTAGTLAFVAADYAEAMTPILAGEFDPSNPDQAAALEQALDRLDESGIRLRDKAQAVAGMSKTLRVWAKNLADERAELERREATYLKQAEWLDENLIAAMESVNVDRFEGQRFAIRVQLNPPKCEIVDEALVPVGFLRYIPEKVTPERWEVNKVAVNAAAKEGELVPGTLVTRSKKLVVS